MVINLFDRRKRRIKRRTERRKKAFDILSDEENREKIYRSLDFLKEVFVVEPLQKKAQELRDLVDKEYEEMNKKD